MRGAHHLSHVAWYNSLGTAQYFIHVQQLSPEADSQTKMPIC